MNCDKVKELLWAYLENKTTAEETAEIETHLEGCAACREELAQQKEIKNALASLPDEELPEGYHTELMQKLQAERKIVPFPAKKKHGCKADGDHLPVTLEGKLTAGVYTLPGNVSSQFITGLLFALPLLEGESEIRLTTKIESKGYIDMTLKTLKTFGITVTETESGWSIPGGQKYHGPRMRYAEGDWSNAAFWLVAGAIGGSIGCQGLDMESPQGDRAIAALLEEFGAETKVALNQITATHKEMKGIRIDASQIPDLVPILCVAAAAAEGKTEIYNAGRLRMKESDRLAVMAECMQKIGVEVEERPDSIIITGGCNPPEGEIVIDSHNDHRIVMAMAIAAVSLGVELTILGAEAVNKSYPSFFIELAKLGGVTNVL